MFKLTLTPTFTAAVVVEFQGGARAAFDATYSRLTQGEVDALSARIEAREATDTEIVDQVLAGWSGVADEDGAALDFTPANRARVLDVAGVRSAIVRAFFDSFPKAKAKN